MELTFELGYLGLVVLALGSIAIGVAFYVFGDPHFNYEWLVTAIAAFVGGFVASEFVTAFQGYEPVWDGLALVPALIGGVIVGGVAAGVTRYLTRSQMSAQAR